MASSDAPFASADGDDHMVFVHPDPAQAVILARVNDYPDPSFSVVAKSRCVKCNEWVWLGPDSFRYVTAGTGVPICQQCGATVVSAENVIGMLDEYNGQGFTR